MSAHRGRELQALHSIDTMVLAGAREEDSLHEIARLVSAVADAEFAAIVKLDPDDGNRQRCTGTGGTGRPRS